MAKKTKKKRPKAITVAPPQTVQDREYEVRSAADTLIQADGIQNNKALFSAARKELANRAKAIQKVIKRQ